MTPTQRCSLPNLWNLWVCYYTWQKKLCRGYYVKDPEMGRLSQIAWVSWYNHEGPRKSKQEVGGSELEMYVKMLMLLSLKMEEGTWTRECRQPLEFGTVEEMDAAWSNWKEHSPADRHLDFSSVIPISDFWLYVVLGY